MQEREYLSREDEARESELARAMEGFLDAEWYCARYPDVIASGIEPIRHFIRHGLREQRNPNPYFVSEWYVEHNPDVASQGTHPLLHYLQVGAAQLRHPSPNFDAAWYADQYPEAASNPLLYHIRVGRERGYPTERPMHIQDYLPSARPTLAPPPRLIVDVVIPVYRGLEETQRCIESVLADPAKPLGRVIVVDDKSPDRALVKWLAKLSERRAIRLIRNPRNAGFVAAVNRGMAEAGNRDVVLLNSDTEVPPGWLGRLAAQAYAGKRIATVSPLSNNATICGYPDDHGGPIAFGLDYRRIDAICQRVNAGRWVEAPTTVGFCMYIRRKALNEVGLFDADRFASGYGEENDFCLRAAALGWKHHIACDTFVYHKGSVSFGGRTARLIEQATRLLLERYPSYNHDVARHVGLGDIVPFRFAVTADLFRQSGLPVILMITHGLGGGVRRHIDSLMERYAGAAHFLLLEATDRGASLSVPELPRHPSVTLSPDRVDDMAILLRSMNVGRLHIHHLLGIDMNIQGLIRRLDVPFDVTIHDYHVICPQINLLPFNYSLYCGEPDVAACNACISRRHAHDARDIITWRADHAWLLQQASRVFCPSQDVITRLRRYGLAANAILAPHEPVEAGPWPLKIMRPKTAKLRIAVLGTLVNHKGARTVAAVAELADPSAIEMHLIGHTDGPFPEHALKRMKVTGRYGDADLTNLIKRVAPHVIWFPAPWPETFSYTLSAAIDAGTPIAATRIGAHAERLEGRPLTWLAEVNTPPPAWIELFNQIRGHLNDGAPNPIPPRPAIEDFYAAEYLRPHKAKPAIRSRRPRIAIIPECFEAAFPTPCAYIRLIQPLNHPAVTPGFDVSISDAETIFHRDADIIVTQRHAMPDAETADRLAAHAKRIGATLVYDLDDDLLAIPPGHPDAERLRPKARTVRRMLQVADQVHVSTPGLAQRIAAIRPGAMIIPNRLDERIWTPPVPPPGGSPVRVLLMGTATHDHDYKMIEPALMRLKLEYQDRVQIEVLGMTTQVELPLGLERIHQTSNAWRSYPGFVQWLTSARPGWHIGLAPLRDTPFNSAKSSIKTMDYAALGLAVLASDTPVYRGSLAERLVPNDPSAWYAALDSLMRDPGARTTMTAAARPAFLKHASLANSDIRLIWTKLAYRHRDNAA